MHISGANLDGMLRRRGIASDFYPKVNPAEKARLCRLTRQRRTTVSKGGYRDSPGLQVAIYDVSTSQLRCVDRGMPVLQGAIYDVFLIVTSLNKSWNVTM